MENNNEDGTKQKSVYPLEWVTYTINPSDYGSKYIEHRHVQSGLNIREYYAGMAMQALIFHYGNESGNANDCAKVAIEYADALIAELNKSEEGNE
jgi:hypothetical protein